MDTMLPTTKQAGFYLFFKRALAIFLFIYAILSGSLLAQDRQIVYNTPGTYTWTPPCGVTQIKVFVWGAGGAGGGANSTNTRGGGGGSGAFVWHYQIPVTYNTSYSIVVGAGGTGVSAANGGNGGNSLFRITSGTIFLESGGGAGGRLNGTKGDRGIIITNYSGSWGTLGGNGADAGAGFSGGGGASGAPISNGSVNASGSAGAIAPIGAYPNTNGGNGGNGRTNDGDGSNGSMPGGGGGGAFYGASSNHRGGNGGNGQVIIEYNGAPSGYCNKDYSTVEPITNVTFAGINNTTSATVNGTPALQKFCPPINAQVNRGSTYTLSVQGNTDGWYLNRFRVYFDWNQNGVFEEPAERTNIGTIFNSTGTDGQTASVNITIPAGAALGKTMMRVVKNYFSNTDACSDETYGQAEDYEVLVYGACQQPTGATANGVSGSLTICAGESLTLRQTGGTLSPDQQWEWTKSNCTASYEQRNTNSDAAYTFTPVGVGTTVFYVKAIGGSCGSSGPCQSVTVTVVAPGTISVNPGYNVNFSACRNTANASMASFAVGGGATSVTPSGLPAGITGTLTGSPGNYTYTLGGTPTAAAGTYNYTLTLNPQTPCAVTSISGTITITDKPTISYSGSPYTFCQNAAITAVEPTVNDGGLTTTYSIVAGGPLPAGLIFNTSTGAISGTPTVISAPANYTIRATNSCGYTDVVINISVILGNTVFNMLPNGSQTHCSTTPGIPISLSGSVLGINYQLYRDGTPVGAAANGTGGVLAMGTHTTAGTYTIVAITGCATNMNGSFTLNITQAPDATFSYGASVFCKTGTNPIPTISGNTLPGGYFTSSGGSLVFADAATGEINLAASNVGTFTITYHVPAYGGCSAYTSPSVNIQIVNGPNTYQIAGGGEYCSGGSGLPVTLNGSQSGATYQLFRDGTPVGSLPGTGAAISFGNQTIAGTYTIQAALSTCTKWMDGSVDISIKPSPDPIAITPSSATLCQNTVIPLSVSGVPPGTSPEQVYSLGSGNINMSIPDNNILGISSLLKVTGVPAGATITRINVQFNINHTYDRDLIINLKGPNSNVLNIANRIGGSGNHFTNTIVASNAGTNISSGSAPFTGTYLPHAALSIQGASTLTGNISNAGGFNDLYSGSPSSLNGNWFFTVRDVAGGDVGQLSNWTINIYYTTVSNPVSVTWSPSSQVFMDAGGTVPYDNSSQARIYAKPSTIGTVPITATYTAGNGCAVTATTNLTVEQSPIITMTADYCSTPGKVKITATSDLPVTDWQWSDGFGTGIGSGNFVRYIEPNTAGTYYVTAKSTASNNCPVSASMSVAQELVVNGDFEAGNTGFTSGYTYKSDFYDGTPTSGLWPEATYTVDYNPQNYHSYFWGTDHTTANGSGKMMMVNGIVGPLVWSQTVTVLPNTVYYFSGYAVSLNDVPPYANLQFRINGVPMPPPAETGVLPSKVPNNEPGTWRKFWGQWNSGSNTSAHIEIIDIISDLGGNDFAIDDISFGTLSSFLNLTSAVNTDNQQACVGVPITQITYEIGGDGSSPVVTGLPAGLTTYWNGRDLRISGTPTASGTFNYNIQQQVCAGAYLNKGGTLNVLPASDAGSFDAPALSACYNSNGSIAVTGNVGSLTWQTSTDGISWTNKTPNNGSYTGVTSALYYRVIAQNGAGCAKDTSVGVKLGIKNLWTGKTNDDWFTATNWSDDLVPTASATPCPDVIIPDMQGTGKPYPIIASSSTPVNNLVIHNRVSPGVSLTILNNSTLQIAGAITAPAASINANDGIIEMNGSGSQNLAGSRFVGKNIEHLKVSGGTLNITSEAAPDTLNILEKLSFGTSTADLNTGDRITLKSTAARTASVGVLNTGNAIGGRFTIERFVQHYLNWNMLTIPVRENISIHSSWQENGAPLTSTSFGTRITGPATPPTTGLDGTSVGYSAKWWDNTLNSGAGNWAPVVNSTTDYVNRRQGYFLFVRGDRGVGPGAPGNITTLRGSGTIFDANNLPSYPITAPVNSSVSLANPYASAIGFNKLHAANSGKIEANFSVWDPTLWGNYGVGGYQTITAITGYKPTPGGSAIYSSGGSYPNVQSGQAVFVQTTTANPTINFAEDFKEDGSLQVARGSQPQTMDNVDPEQVVMLSTHLYAADGRIMDGNRVVFDDNYSDEVDYIDAKKYKNSYINFGLLRHNKDLSVEAKSSLKATDTLFYKMSGLPNGSFKMGVSVQNIIAPQLQAELIDNYLHTRTPVSLTDSTWINFTTTADAASKAANRFMMVFRSTGVVLPVTFVQIAAQRNADRSIDVQWQVANEVNILRYEVERSADGQQFAGILTREAANYNTYRQTDLSPLAMDNFYRIKAIGLNGEILYSAIVKVAPDKSPALITVSPNPVKDKQLQVRFTKYAPGNYTILLSNALGQEIYRRGVTVQGSSFVKTISLQSTLAGGHYRLSVYDAEGNRLHSEALMVE